MASKIDISYTYTTEKEALEAKKEIDKVYEGYLKKNPDVEYTSTISIDENSIKLKIVIVKDGSNKKIPKGR